MLSTPSTETRGAWLWRKMMNVYGARFLDMWEGVDVSEMQVTWTEGLRGLSREAIQRGVSRLYHAKHPPTLPEFIALCEPSPAMHRQNTLALTNEANRTPPEQAREQLVKVREVAQSLVRPVERGSGVAWAQRLIDRAQRGEHVTLHQLACAKAAIEQWQITHGTMRHTREPGSDDE
ncbi:hypothetical protein [Paraburkholderia humisilvae]|uniref:Uncharacterized protein n=1 Tax=Paraburkholderia humisilvae TaxID=627669 RepID=A0A6J5DX03_9BURK|nr:hypothetical protein [Paraburkholderia humisilvae]CAB3758503.1 hypothetical protein LMG29542_03359 [Paraburkholderia humisilvae]